MGSAIWSKKRQARIHDLQQLLSEFWNREHNYHGRDSSWPEAKYRELVKVPGRSSKHRAKETARFVEPMQCLPIAKLPEGSNWEYEVKFDGYRALANQERGPREVDVSEPE